jgi:hypothetical protein
MCRVLLQGGGGMGGVAQLSGSRLLLMLA